MNERPASDARIYILGGNASTLAFVSSLRPDNRQITAWLAPLAWTPVGVVVGEGWQRVNIAADNVPGWVDQTFSPEDDRSFVSSLRDLEMLIRVGWHSEAPIALTEDLVLNPEDLPEDVLDALAHPEEQLTQCAVCRRTCVRDHFVWNERRLCAWDYHATVFGKRGPWQAKAYEERYFETLPKAKYVAHGLLEDVGVDAILVLDDIEEQLARKIVNEVMEAEPDSAHLAVRTESGMTLLRERKPEPRP